MFVVICSLKSVNSWRGNREKSFMNFYRQIFLIQFWYNYYCDSSTMPTTNNKPKIVSHFVYKRCTYQVQNSNDNPKRYTVQVNWIVLRGKPTRRPLERLVTSLLPTWKVVWRPSTPSLPVKILHSNIPTYDLTLNVVILEFNHNH